MTNNFSKLVQFWQKASYDFGLKITTPYSLLLSSGHRINAILLVHQYGGTKGMLICEDYDEVQPYLHEISEAGFGFLIADKPMEDERYCKEEYMELLVDWGSSIGDK